MNIMCLWTVATYPKLFQSQGAKGNKLVRRMVDQRKIARPVDGGHVGCVSVLSLEASGESDGTPCLLECPLKVLYGDRREAFLPNQIIRPSQEIVHHFVGEPIQRLSPQRVPLNQIFFVLKQFLHGDVGENIVQVELDDLRLQLVPQVGLEELQHGFIHPLVL